MDEDGQPIRFSGLRPVALQCGRVDVDGGCVRPVGDDTVHPCRHLLRISCPGECHGAIMHVLAGAFVDCGFQRGGFVRSGQPCALDDGAGMILVRSASVMMMVTRRISVLPSPDDAHMARSLR